MSRISIRHERLADANAIHDLTRDAFAGMPFSDGTEAVIPGLLREAGDLTLSLVATDGRDILGHVAFSPVTITPPQPGTPPDGWFGLGPVSVLPDRQRKGIGESLIRTGLGQLRASGASGCVVLGSQGYYRRFGFIQDPALVYPHAPAEHFQRLAFTEPAPAGTVTFREAFETGTAKQTPP